MSVGEDIAALTDPTFGEEVPAAEFFVKGGCHQLALALVSAIDGARFVAVYDHVADDGSPLENPRMVHAAALIGRQLVIDVEGIKDRDGWVDAWSDLARDPSYIEWEPDELPFEFTSPAHMRFSETVATRLVEEFGPLLSLPSPPTPARGLASPI